MVLITLVFALFVLERYPPEVTAFCGACLALLLGLISPDDVLAAIANPAPATIGAMFVLSAALVRTGALDVAVMQVRRLAAVRPVTALLVFMGAAAAASAFMNNTPVVMVLIPIAIALGQQMGIAGSRLLIPLSYMVILGGTVTMIGTSTNLLVDGVARDIGLAPFGLFEIAPLGIAVALVGGAFLALTGRALLPSHGPSVTSVTPRGRSWLAELFIPAGSAAIGRPVQAIERMTRGRGRVVDVIRGDSSLRRDRDAIRLEAGDRVVVRTSEIELMGFREGVASGVEILGAEPGGARRTRVMEVLVAPRSRVVGRPLSSLNWRRRFGVYPIALHRDGGQVSGLETAILTVGDLLLIDGAPGDITRATEELRLLPLSTSAARAYRRNRAPIALAVLGGVVGLAALDVAPILPLALIGVALVFMTGCLDADEGIDAMDGRLLLLVISMLMLGTALDNSGALGLVVDWLAPLLEKASPLLALALVYALTSLLTELVTNNAVAVLMAPIAAGVATSLGLDPRPFVVAVMFGASASFATPIGYQTNTLVFNAGGYRFGDFLRIGVPMNLIVGAVTVTLIPLLWPLEIEAASR